MDRLIATLQFFWKGTTETAAQVHFLPPRVFNPVQENRQKYPGQEAAPMPGNNLFPKRTQAPGRAASRLPSDKIPAPVLQNKWSLVVGDPRVEQEHRPAPVVLALPEPSLVHPLHQRRFADRTTNERRLIMHGERVAPW